MNNILFFLTPKAMCAYLYDDYTIRQALEKMEGAGYAALPILNRRGEYRGTLTEGDLLWAMKNLCYMDMRQAEARRIMEISRRRDNVPVRVTTSMQDLLERPPPRIMCRWWTIRTLSSASFPGGPSSNTASSSFFQRIERFSGGTYLRPSFFCCNGHGFLIE